MRFPRLAPYLVAAAVVALLAAAWQGHLAPLHELSLKVNDLKYRLQPENPGEQVVFVAVDEKSVNRLGRWPWPRSRLAEGLARLEPASVVLLDMVFSESAAPAGDRRLTRTIGGMGNAVCGFFRATPSAASSCVATPPRFCPPPPASG